MSTALSVREQALRAVVAALGAAGTPAEGVTRSQLEQLEQADLPCFDVSPGEGKVLEVDGADRNSVWNVQPFVVRAMVDATGSHDGALDPLYVWAVQQLTAGRANLGGVVIDVQEQGSGFVFRPAGRNILGLEMHFEMTFATKRGDPTQKG